MTAEPFRATVRTLLRDRLFDAAAGVFSDEGWRRLTMAKVADRAGVSRQTVYNEFGTKQQLAEQLVMRELETFLDIVRQRFDQESDFVPAVRSAIAGALETADQNALLRTVLGSGQAGGSSGDSELLPFITQSQSLIERATGFLMLLVGERFPDVALHGERLRVALESVVRLVLSHITQPTEDREQAADELAWLVGAVVAGAMPAGAGEPTS